MTIHWKIKIEKSKDNKNKNEWTKNFITVPLPYIFYLTNKEAMSKPCITLW